MTVRALLERTRILGGVSPEALAELERGAVLRRFRRKEPLFVAGETPRSLLVLRAGLVKVVRSAPNGRGIVCGLFGAPESVGDVPLLAGSLYPATAVACTRAEVCAVPRGLVLEVLGREPALLGSVLTNAQDKLRLLLSKIEILSAGTVEARLAALLLHLQARFGDELDDGTELVPVHLARQELADLVATTTETIIRTLGRWQDEGLVEVRRSGILLRAPAELRNRSGAH